MKKFIFLFAFLVIGMVANAQVSIFTQPGGQAIDSVANSGVAYVTSPRLAQAPATTTTVIVSVTKISGTVGGVISLQGSLNGTTWVALNQPNIQTAVTTITASDASANYHWIVTGSSFPYYRVSWTGTGTMAASFGASLYRSK